MTTIDSFDCQFPLIDPNKHVNFKPGSLQPFSIIVCGSRNQGKSVLIRYLYERYFSRRYDIVVVFSSTLMNGWYPSFINSKLMFEEYHPYVIDNLRALQNIRLSKRRKLYNVLIIFDDCIANKMKYNEDIQFLFTRGRHLGLSVIFATQSPTYCAPIWRQNTTHLFLLKCKGTALDHIIDNFLIDLFEADDFTDVTRPHELKDKIREMLHVVFDEKYRMLVVKYDEEGNTYRECVFHFKINL